MIWLYLRLAAALFEFYGVNVNFGLSGLYSLTLSTVGECAGTAVNMQPRQRNAPELLVATNGLPPSNSVSFVRCRTNTKHHWQQAIHAVITHGVSAAACSNAQFARLTALTLKAFESYIHQQVRLGRSEGPGFRCRWTIQLTLVLRLPCSSLVQLQLQHSIAVQSALSTPWIQHIYDSTYAERRHAYTDA
jgi:hypothetical protein